MLNREVGKANGGFVPSAVVSALQITDCVGAGFPFPHSLQSNQHISTTTPRNRWCVDGRRASATGIRA